MGKDTTVSLHFRAMYYKEEKVTVLYVVFADCFLERMTAAHIAAGRAPPLTIGLAFDEQILEDYCIPMETHDKVLDFVVTPTRTFSNERKKI